MTRVPTPEYRGLLNARAEARETAKHLFALAGRAFGPPPAELRAAMVAEERAEAAVDAFAGQKYEDEDDPPSLCRVCGARIERDLNEGTDEAPMCGRCTAGPCEVCEVQLAKADDHLDVGGLLFCLDCAEEPQDCPSCSATGEGMYDGSSCSRCAGRGHLGTPRQTAARQGYEF